MIDRIQTWLDSHPRTRLTGLSVIATAAQRARTILAEIDDLVMTEIQSELRRSGSIRSARFDALLVPAMETRATVETLR